MRFQVHVLEWEQNTIEVCFGWCKDIFSTFSGPQVFRVLNHFISDCPVIFSQYRPKKSVFDVEILRICNFTYVILAENMLATWKFFMCEDWYSKVNHHLNFLECIHISYMLKEPLKPQKPVTNGCVTDLKTTSYDKLINLF